MKDEIDPDLLPILEQMRAAPPVDYEAMPIAAARAIFNQAALPWSMQAPLMHDIEDLSLKGAAGPMRARLYRPEQGILPLVVFVHGGGWTFGSVDTHESEMRHLALASGAAVIGMDYRLAPENPFPAGMEDVLAAIAQIRAGALAGKADASRIALAGDSAGANLALAAMLALRHSGAELPRGAALHYGCFAPQFNTESHRDLGDGRFGLSTSRMAWYWRNFLGGSTENPPALAAPLGADLHGLPPLYLAAAGLDPLRDDTLAMAAALSAASVPHEMTIVPGVIHGFLRMAQKVPAARQSAEAAGAFLKARLN